MTDKEGLLLLEKFEDLTRDAARHQLDALESILRCNSGVRYLRPFLGGHDPPVDVAAFRRQVPLSSYEDYAHHIGRMAEGLGEGDDDPILSVDPLICFFYSSGTSSMKPKLIPYFDSPLSKAASVIAHQGSAAVLRRLFPPKPTENKVLWFIYAGNVTYTKAGLKVMAASAFPMHQNKARSSQFLSTSVSPPEVILGSDVQCQMYCHLLCGLRHFDLIDSIRAPYAVGLVRALSLLEEKWEQLCDDIEKGVPGLEINDVEMRDSVIKVLGGPQRDLSERIRSVCRTNSWDGILIKLWPNLRYIKCITTGSMMHYYPKLKRYGGEVPLLGGDYFASECCVAINLDLILPPERTRFVLLPTAAYFEFLPFDSTKSGVVEEEIVDVSGVEVGKVYEVVATTYRGLYRYLLGDVVRVVGFYNSSPKLEYVMRAPKSSSSDVVTEIDLISAVENVRASLEDVLEAEITDYASFLDFSLNPKQMKVYIEVKEAAPAEDTLKAKIADLRKCCSALEEDLGPVYQVQKNRGELGPLMVYILTPGSFDGLLQAAIEKGAPASQYKHPKIIRNCEMADLFQGFALATVC